MVHQRIRQKQYKKTNELRTNYGAEVFAIGIGSNLTSTNIELKGITNDPDSYYLEYIAGFINLCGNSSQNR